MTEDRLANGLVIILPGIEGESYLNQNIRKGLLRGGVFRAMPIYAWGRPIPLAGVLLNQLDFIGNRLEGAKIARMIVKYQDEHPGRPVCLVGHSGGGGVAVFAAEGLPSDRQIDGLVLLSASINSAYDLTKALSRCKNGIVNFYNKSDTALLGVGTLVIGNVDGTHGPSAGLGGFAWSRSSDSDDKRSAYRKLYQVQVTRRMTSGGDPHASTTRRKFVSNYIVPWVLAPDWPVGRQAAETRRSAESVLPKALASAGR